MRDASKVLSFQRSSVRGMLLIACLTVFLLAHLIQASSVYDDYLQEVLEEAQADMEEDNYYDEMSDHEKLRSQFEEDELMKEEEERIRREEEAMRKEEQLRLAREKTKQQREEAFEAELRQMTADRQKIALAQKRKDAKVVRRVLRAAEMGDLYGVIGLRNMEFQIPSRTIKLGKMAWTIPGVSLFHISEKVIRKSYRLMALRVHPDKNKDGRAEEAFVAVENAASILSNDDLRREYDEQIREDRRVKIENARRLISNTLSRTLRVSNNAVAVFRKVLGPFAVPVSIIGVLLI